MIRGGGEGGGDGVQSSEANDENVGARFIAPCFAGSATPLRVAQNDGNYLLHLRVFA